jgi:hypothetical protein
MGTGGITINGQHYGSPEEMPADVRRTYEEAMRAIGPAVASGNPSGMTQVFSGSSGLGMNASVVVRKSITVNNRTYQSLEEMPPDVRQFVERGLQQASGTTGTTGATAAGRHFTVNTGDVHVRTSMDPGSPFSSSYQPIEPRPLDPAAKQFLVNLIFWVLGALLFWTFLGR